MALQDLPRAPARTECSAQEIPKRLRAARQAQKITLKDAAFAMKTTPQTVQRLETGNMTMSLEWLDRMCAVYKLTPAILFANSGAAQAAAMQRLVDEMRDETRVLHAQSTNFIDKLDSFLVRTK